MLVSTKLLSVSDPEGPYASSDISVNDPYYNSVTLLLHAEDTNSLSSTIYESVWGMNIRVFPLPSGATGPRIITTPGPYGSAYPGSLYLDGNGAGIYLEPGDLLPGTSLYNRDVYNISNPDDWTITFWHKTDTTGRTSYVEIIFLICAKLNGQSIQNTTGNVTLTCHYSSSLGYYYTVYRNTTSTTPGTFYQNSGAHVHGGWNYVMAMRSLTAPFFTLSVNGNRRQSSASYNSNFLGGTSSPWTLRWFDSYILAIGKEYGSSSRQMKGQLRDLKFNDGAYPNSYIVPNAPAEVDYFGNGIRSTLMIFPFDAGAGATDNSLKLNYVSASTSGGVITDLNSVYGTRSFYFNGGNLTSPSNQAVNFGTNDFTIEMYVKFQGIGSCYFISGGSNISSFTFFLRYDAGYLQWFVVNGATGGIKSRRWNPITNFWYNLTICRNSGKTRIFINGTMFMNFADFSNIGDNGFTLGGADGLYFYGWMDEIRITKGVGRYQNSYLLRSSAFPNQ